MIQLRKSADRGHNNFGWLDARHTFSFGEYYDPEHLGFRDLRVINQDIVSPGRGFPTHSHRDMEIITYVLEGAVEHKDSMGNGSIIRPGDIQYMSAGSGVTHSEYNPLNDKPLQLLQIWILPREKGAAPRYSQKHIPDLEKRDRLRLFASPDGAEGSIAIRQDVRLYGAILTAGQSLTIALATGRHGWIQLVRGRLHVNDATLSPGDGAATSDERSLTLRASEEAEFLFFDLA